MAEATGACFFASSFSPLLHRNFTPRLISVPRLHFLGSATRRSALQSSISDTTPIPIPVPNRKYTDVSGRLRKEKEDSSTVLTPFMVEEEEASRVSLKDFFELAESLVRSDNGVGPPRWFSPLPRGCSSRLDNCPLLLYLPGIDGTGAGLALQQKRLGKVFDIWSMHIPVMDRTTFSGLVNMVEKTIRSESNRCPNRPIYIVGESLGGCIALAVAARNPNIDLVLILANPATSFDKSPLQSLAPLLEIMPDQLQLTNPFLLSLMRGDPFRVLRAMLEKGLPQEQTVSELSKDIILTITSYISILTDILPKRTLLWKLQMLRSAVAYTNPRLHAVKAQILLLISGNDQLIPISAAESSRLYRALPGCDIRKLGGNGNFLFLEPGVNLMMIIKATCFYRRGKSIDFVADYLPPTPSEFTYVYESTKLTSDITSPVILSTLEDGTIIKGLAGIPPEGPVLYVGYHMLLGFELVPLVIQVLLQRNIHLRGIAHPMMFEKYKEGVSIDPSIFDNFRLMGAVPVSGSNLFKLLRQKSNVLLYPGGVREALHRKGEQYKLFWPEEAEFVRMAARFGAKIVPFGAVGEDDIGEVVVDYADLMKIPFFRDQIRHITEDNGKLRTDATGEVTNQDLHLPGIMPRIPGRFYFFFGKAIETQGRKKELRDRDKSQELYLEVKSEVEKCIDYLKHKREKDPYRSIFSRIIYRTIHGPESDVPTFQLESL